MDNSPSPYLRKISLIVKTGTTFSFRGQLNYPILLLVTLACSVVILSDFVGSQEHGIQHAFLHRRVYEAPVLIFLILNIPILILKRANISELIELLLEQFDEVSFGEESIKAAKHFFKWINVIGTIVIFNNFFLFACCIMVLGPLCTLPFYPADTTIQDLPLPMGMIPFHTDSYFVYAAFYITSSFSILAVCAFHSSWYLLLVFSSLRIKARLRMLVNTIDSLDEVAAIRSMVLTEIAQCSRHRISQEDMLIECTDEILGEAISEHVKIMRYVKLVSNTFSLSLMIFIQGAILVCALLLRQVTDITGPKLLLEYPYKIHMIIAGLFNIWVFSHCGQIIISESIKFRSSLYGFDWTEKSQKFKSGIVLMMLVATKPLEISVGGIYSLSLFTFRYMVQAIYSYINILLYLRKNTNE